MSHPIAFHRGSPSLFDLETGEKKQLRVSPKGGV